jgi:uncharacterized alkaline shock family protein YloU
VIELERTSLGTIGVDERVLGTLAEQAAHEAPGVHEVRKPEVVLDDGSLSVSLAVVVEPGAVMPEVGRAVQERVAGALTTAIEPAGDVRVDVTVEGVEG